ncbi:MAG TPA: hypothetical protein VF520_02245 [Thermoleophilaceae bacterium]
MAAVASGLLAAPAAASPTTVGTATAPLAGGPRLAGDSLLYSERGSRRIVLRLATAGADPRKLRSEPVPAPPNEEEESPGDFESSNSALAASGERLAYALATTVGNARYQQGRSTVTLLGGTLAGPFGEASTCSSEGIYGPASSTVDVDGPRVASTDCVGRIVVRDYGAGPEPVVATLAPSQGLAASDLALAGDLVAFNAYGIGPSGSSAPTTEVYDWRTGTRLYAVPRATSFDLQPDGTLATARAGDASCDGGRLTWSSPAEPVEHVLPASPCRGDVKLAGGRIATVVRSGAGPRRTLALIALDGAQIDAADLGPLGMQEGEIDYDGRSVAYALRDCSNGSDLLRESAAVPAPRDEPTACETRIRSPRANLARGTSSVAIPIGCPDGCFGVLALRARVGRHVEPIGQAQVLVRPVAPCGPSQELATVTLARAARDAIRARGELTALAALRTRDRDGRDRATKRRIVLRAAGSSARGAQAC